MTARKDGVKTAQIMVRGNPMSRASCYLAIKRAYNK